MCYAHSRCAVPKHNLDVFRFVNTLMTSTVQLVVYILHLVVLVITGNVNCVRVFTKEYNTVHAIVHVRVVSGQDNLRTIRTVHLLEINNKARVRFHRAVPRFFVVIWTI